LTYRKRGGGEGEKRIGGASGPWRESRGANAP